MGGITMKRWAPVRPLLLAAALTAAIAIAACGDEAETASSVELSGFVPSDSVVYAEAVVRPEGDQREEAESALGTLLGTDDPGAMIRDAINSGLEDDGLTYEDAIEPWLGERVAAFATGFGERAEYAVIAETTDPETALETVRADLEDEGGVRERTYEGTTYLLSSEDDVAATGIVDDHLVSGSVEGFERVVDTVGGESIADSGALGPGFEAVSGGLASFYADPSGLIDALAQAGEIPAAQVETIQAQLGAVGQEPVVGGFDIGSDNFSLEFSTASPEQGAGTPGDLIENLPADSWLALGIGDLGALAQQAIAAFDAQIQAGPVVPPELRGGLEATVRRELGVDLGEIFSWMGDVSGYVRGTSIFGLGAAVIVETSDEEATLDTLDQLRSALERNPQVVITPLTIEGEGFQIAIRETPVQIPVVVRDGRLVAGLGEASVEQALSPDETLGESETFSAVTDDLGDDFEPTVLVDFEPILQLVESTGEVASDPDYAEVKPYLDALDFLAGGVRTEGDRTTVRLVLGLDG
jgi:Protein of unknown function (DUF3352)